MRTGRPPQNIKGIKFGRLTTVAVHSTGHDQKWICACDCGNVTVCYQKHLLRGCTRSCGCLAKEIAVSKIAHKILPPGEAFIRGRFSALKRDAKKRKLEISLTFEDFRSLSSKTCHYCGEPPVISPYYSTAKQTSGAKMFNGTLPLNGIDRLDSAKGYTHDNVATCCCWTCNRNKGPMSQEQFETWINKVYCNLNGRPSG